MSERPDPLAPPEGYGQQRPAAAAGGGRLFEPARAVKELDDVQCDFRSGGRVRCPEQRGEIWTIGCASEHICQVDLCASHASHMSRVTRHQCMACGALMALLRRELPDGTVIFEADPASLAAAARQQQGVMQAALDWAGFR